MCINKANETFSRFSNLKKNKVQKIRLLTQHKNRRRSSHNDSKRSRIQSEHNKRRQRHINCVHRSIIKLTPNLHRRHLHASRQAPRHNTLVGSCRNKHPCKYNHRRRPQRKTSIIRLLQEQQEWRPA